MPEGRLVLDALGNQFHRMGAQTLDEQAQVMTGVALGVDLYVGDERQQGFAFRAALQAVHGKAVAELAQFAKSFQYLRGRHHLSGEFDDDLLRRQEGRRVAQQGLGAHIDEGQLAFEQPVRTHIEQGVGNHLNAGFEFAANQGVFGILGMPEKQFIPQ